MWFFYLQFISTYYNVIKNFLMHIKKIIVLSIGEIQLRNDLDNYAIISYKDASGVDIVSIQNFSLPQNDQIVNHKHILCIEADDVDANVVLQKESVFSKLKSFFKTYNQAIPVTLFNLNKANEVIEFVKKNQDKNIIVQCVYGKSRSLKTAIFIENYLLSNTHKLEHQERIIRNQSFMDILKKANNI